MDSKEDKLLIKDENQEELVQVEKTREEIFNHEVVSIKSSDDTLYNIKVLENMSKKKQRGNYSLNSF